jgi:branched-subunit amino acid aminotransferase/4-amino-4-deoxychorismate lyase
LERLERGAGFLGISIPFGSEALRYALERLLQENGMSDALLRLTLSRGTGVRGYSPKGAHQPFLVMSLHPAPALSSSELLQWQLVTSSFRLPINDPLAQYKTCNKLAQILSRASADARTAEEALLVNSDGHIVEGTSSNLFWVAGATVCTPPLGSGILDGVTRSVVLELCRKHNLPTRQTNLKPEQLPTTDGVFLSLSSFGIVEAVALDGQPLARSSVTAQIGQAYLALLHDETSVVSRTSLRIDSV